MEWKFSMEKYLYVMIFFNTLFYDKMADTEVSA